MAVGFPVAGVGTSAQVLKALIGRLVLIPGASGGPSSCATVNTPWAVPAVRGCNGVTSWLRLRWSPPDPVRLCGLSQAFREGPTKGARPYGARCPVSRLRPSSPTLLAGSAGGHAWAAPSASGAPEETAMTHSAFHEGPFAPVTEEVTAFDLPVTGSLPVELSGRHLRNGPNPIGLDDAAAHWFLGAGMVHGVRLRDDLHPMHHLASPAGKTGSDDARLQHPRPSRQGQPSRPRR
jgi:Retinal pigment epithelial membrane protein